MIIKIMIMIKLIAIKITIILIMIISQTIEPISIYVFVIAKIFVGGLVISFNVL